MTREELHAACLEWVRGEYPWADDFHMDVREGAISYTPTRHHDSRTNPWTFVTEKDVIPLFRAYAETPDAL